MKFPLWLLKRFYRGPYAESLLGDLLEEHHRGRGALWLWKQVISAIVLSRARGALRSIRIGAMSAAGWILIELSLVLPIIVVLDEWRRTHSIAGWFSFKGLLSLGILVGAGALGYALHSRAKNLLVIVTVSLLGAGTFVWAGTALADACEASATHQTIVP